jgi:hypothetical protein
VTSGTASRPATRWAQVGSRATGRSSSSRSTRASAGNSLQQSASIEALRRLVRARPPRRDTRRRNDCGRNLRRRSQLRPWSLPSKRCRPEPRMAKLRYVTSAQSRSGGGEGCKSSGRRVAAASAGRPFTSRSSSPGRLGSTPPCRRPRSRGARLALGARRRGASTRTCRARRRRTRPSRRRGGRARR